MCFISQKTQEIMENNWDSPMFQHVVMNFINMQAIILQGVPYPGLPKRDKPRRVEHYFSSWVIRAGEYRVNPIIPVNI